MNPRRALKRKAIARKPDLPYILKVPMEYDSQTGANARRFMGFPFRTLAAAVAYQERTRWVWSVIEHKGKVVARFDREGERDTKSKPARYGIFCMHSDGTVDFRSRTFYQTFKSKRSAENYLNLHPFAKGGLIYAVLRTDEGYWQDRMPR